MMTSMNEQTHFFIKNIPLTLDSWKGWCFLCVRGELETGTDCHILTQSSLTIAALHSHLGWGCSTVGYWGPKPSVWSWLARGHLVPNWLQLQLNYDSLKPSVAPGYIIVWYPPASCGRTHLHRIQPRPQFKGIFRYLRPDAPVFAVVLLIYTGASLDWWLCQGSICYIIML